MSHPRQGHYQGTASRVIGSAPIGMPAKMERTRAESSLNKGARKQNNRPTRRATERGYVCRAPALGRESVGNTIPRPIFKVVDAWVSLLRRLLGSAEPRQMAGVQKWGIPARREDQRQSSKRRWLLDAFHPPPRYQASPRSLLCSEPRLDKHPNFKGETLAGIIYIWSQTTILIWPARSNIQVPTNCTYL